MRTYDEKYAKELNAEDWMIKQLELNPSYVHWGPYEDYMCNSGQWCSRLVYDNWSEMFGLDELNECVNFYFSVERDSKDCDCCSASGYNKETKMIADQFYSHSSRDNCSINTPNGLVKIQPNWHSNLCQEEVDALVLENRLHEFTSEFTNGKWVKKKTNVTADEVNNANRKTMVHDGINRIICIESYSKRLGVYGLCNECNGSGYKYVEDKARLALVLWILHPRKGASRGVHIKNIKKDELQSVYEFLNGANKRNQERFCGLAKVL